MAAEPPQTERPITLLERYCLTRELIGWPHHLTIIVTYPFASLPSVAFLERRIRELQEHYPALYARLVDRKTKRPRWIVGTQPWDPSAILETLDLEAGDDLESVVKREMVRFVASVNLDEGVYWQVRRHVPRSDAANAYITLSTSHVLMDGRAMLATLTALLASAPPVTTEPAISVPLDASEFSPGMAVVLPLVWSNLVVPRLPLFLQRRLPQPAQNWPKGDAEHSANLVDCPANISYLAIPASLSTRIKTCAKKNDASFQIMLKVAYLVALWKVLRPNGDALQLSAVTPRDDRSLPSHSRLTGAFASATTLSTSFSPSVSYWDLVRQWTAVLRDPNEPPRARRKTGVLAYIPDPDNFESDDPRRCTGWEDFWLDKLEGKGSSPTGDSCELSNLGATNLPPGATDLAWVQPPNPIGGAIRAGVVGHEGGLRFTHAWREGYCITEEQIKKVEQVFVMVLERVVEGGGEMVGELAA